MKYIVMQIENGQAVLLDNKGNFITVKDNGYSVGQTIQYRSTSLRRAYATAASFIAVIGLGVGGYKLYYTPVSYLSIEINPSIQLAINVFDRVIGYEYFNDDGKLILEDIDIQNGKSTLSVEKIIDTAQSQGYLSEQNNSVIIDVVENNTALIENLTPLQGKYIPKNIEVVVERATDEDAKLSKDKNISIAKAKAVNEYSQVFGGSVEENSEVLKEVSVKELRKKNKSVEIKATSAPEVTQEPVVTAKPILASSGSRKKDKNRYDTASTLRPTFIPTVSQGFEPVTNNGEKIEKPVFENSFNEEIKDKNKTESTEPTPEVTTAPEVTIEPSRAPITQHDRDNHFGGGFIKNEASEREENIINKDDKTIEQSRPDADVRHESNGNTENRVDNDVNKDMNRGEASVDGNEASRPNVSDSKPSVGESAASDSNKDTASSDKNSDKADSNQRPGAGLSSGFGDSNSGKNESRPSQNTGESSQASKPSQNTDKNDSASDRPSQNTGKSDSASDRPSQNTGKSDSASDKPSQSAENRDSSSSKGSSDRGSASKSGNTASSDKSGGESASLSGSKGSDKKNDSGRAKPQKGEATSRERK